jgi:hypothetical protein
MQHGMEKEQKQEKQEEEEKEGKEGKGGAAQRPGLRGGLCGVGGVNWDVR